MKRVTAAILAVFMFLPILTLNTGCSDDQEKAFRTLFMPGLQSGLQAIIDAAIQGAVAAATPDASLGQ